MHIQTDRAFVPANTPAVRYLQVVIGAPAQTPAAGVARPPVDVALVLDRSGSMAGTKIEMARAAVGYAVRLLKPIDHLAVVCYDDQVTTVLDRTHATPEARKLASDRLALIDARGATDLCGGWLRGAELAKRPQPGGAGISKVMLLTDGLANNGVVDHEVLVAKARTLRADGVATSTFGVGADFDEDLLSSLATEGGGHFYFIEKAQQIPDFLASELGETLEVVAREVAFEVACDPGIEAAVLNGWPSEFAGGVLNVRFGNLVADQEITFIVAVLFKGSHAEGSSLGVRCRVTDQDHVLHPAPIEVTWSAASAAEDSAQPVNQEVCLAAATALAERARSAALAANRREDFDAAQRILREVVDDLRAMAPGDPRVLALIDQLHDDEPAFAEMMTPMARKARHFAAYSASHSRAEGGTARRTKRPR
ncbi:MAG: VWA domain-containing protein [Vicinamibacterales bacterium]